MTPNEKLRKLWKALKGDGCTSSPDLSYTECCRKHDADYTYHIDESGKEITRAEADKRLFNCMRKAGVTPVVGRLFIPAIYWFAVRLFARGHWKQ
ncbi:MAG: phospholipase A2 group XIII [Siphoviridae sp. ctdEk19]|nr:MAG: phospholipase A2 group XIII [Siphoviridae sp. ctdEk19]